MQAIAGAVVFAAVLIVLAWLADSAHLLLHPWPLVTSSLVVTAGILRGVRRREATHDRAAATAACVIVSAGFALYAGWLSWPSLLPLGDGPDIVHHLTLIHFIQHRATLPHDPMLGAYLGEMNTYTPGSHLLAALLAGVLGVDAVRVLHPVTAVFVGLKAGLLFAVLLQLFEASRPRVAASLAGVLLLLVPHAYLLEPFTHYGFYSQVVAETFALAMLWAAAAWHRQPSYGMAALCSLYGIAVVLSWPVFMPPPALAVLLVVITRRSLPWPDRIRHLAVALAPIALVAIAYSATHVSSAGILSSGGSVLTPSVRLFGVPFLALAAAGLALGIRRWTAWLPLLAFGAACVAQIGALVALQGRLGATNFYLGFKTVHLLVYAMVAFAALPIQAVAVRLRGRTAWVLPALVLVWISRGDLPRRPISSPFTEPVYRAGMWAREHVPAQCVDYFVHDWVTGYWLHIDVLGNARASERMRTERFDEATAIGGWIEGRGRRFAIAEDVEALPADVRPAMRVVQRFGPAAVLERADDGGACKQDRR